MTNSPEPSDVISSDTRIAVREAIFRAIQEAGPEAAQNLLFEHAAVLERVLVKDSADLIEGVELMLREQ